MQAADECLGELEVGSGDQAEPVGGKLWREEGHGYDEAGKAAGLCVAKQHISVSELFWAADVVGPATAFRVFADA